MSHTMNNPIIPGFYPDPSIIRVGQDFYLVNSSFELCPGLPVFHSKDLVHWEQICNAMTKENGLHVERNSMVGAVMAPTIRYNNGTYYILNANFSDKGNYIITAADPAGPWSQPHFLDDVPGIDASFFFDTDGQCYIMGTGDVWDNGAGKMERGIWLAKYDIENFKMASEPVTIFNSALRVGSAPEAPHLYHIGNYYYLMIAEGGTEHYHAVMVARSKDIFGFYEGCPANPVMTHRYLGFKAPILNVGHADFVELEDGSWYAVMLGSRLIAGECKNLGRETFICPVEWEREWPLFSPGNGQIQWSYEAPASLPWTEYPPEATWDDFNSPALPLYWVFWGTPYGDFWRIKDSRLTLDCIHQALADEMAPMQFVPTYPKDKITSFVARRQNAIHATATTQMTFTPSGTESAGLAVIQAMNHQYHLERAVADGQQVVRLVRTTAEYPCPPYFPGFESHTAKETVAQAPWDAADIVLQIDLNEEDFTVRYGADKDSLQTLCVADGRLINPEKVGCMSGTIVGMYATGNGVDSPNSASFDWFELI